MSDNWGAAVWLHVEELENLLTLIPPDEILSVIKEKFEDEESRTMDLSTFLAKKTGLPRLNLHLFMPIGETKAWQILRMLSAQDEARKKNSK